MDGFALPGIGLGGLAASDGVGWERKKKKPSTIGLQWANRHTTMHSKFALSQDLSTHALLYGES